MTHGIAHADKGRTFGDGTGLYLGWDRPVNRPSFGFSRPTELPAGTRPMTYDGDGHLVTVAPTGAGKGIGVIIPNLLTYTGPVIVTDIKGENYQVTARRRREMGHRVVVLDPFHLVTDEGDSLNPFDLFDLPGADLECDAEMIAAQLSSDHTFGSDRYWEDTGRGLISGLIAHVASTETPEKRNLTELRRLIYHDDLDYHIAVLLDTKKVVSPLARDEFVSYLSAPSDRTRPCIRSTASTYLKSLGSISAARGLASSSFDLADVLEGRPMTIYIVIPPEKLESHRSLLRLWVATLLTAVVRRKRLPRQRTLFLLDEVAQLGGMPLLRQAVTLLRGYGLQVWTFWQELGQMRRLYPKDWTTLLSNASVVQAFGVPTYGALREWREVLGPSVAELRRLAPEEMLVASYDDGIRQARRANYLHDRAFAGKFDSNQRFGDPEASAIR